MPQKQPLGTYEVREFQGHDYQTAYAGRGGYVRFWIEPPFSTVMDEEERWRKKIKLHPSEGWIDVLMTADGHLEVRGAHRLSIVLQTSNVCEIKLTDH